MDIKSDLADFVNWSNQDFFAAVAAGAPGYNVTVESWLRQRAYVAWAVQELGEGGGCLSVSHGFFLLLKDRFLESSSCLKA